MKNFYVEKYNASDEDYLITEVSIESGNYVTKEQPIAIFESSKASIDIVSEIEGFVYHQLKKGNRIAVGEILFKFTDKEIDNQDTIFPSKKVLISPDNLAISKKALKMIADHNIDISVFKNSIIKEKDVLEYINNTSRKQFNKSIIQITSDKYDSAVVILGSEGGAKMCIDAIRSSNQYQIAGMLDSKKKVGDIIMGVHVIGDDSNIDELMDMGIKNFVLAFGIISKRNIRYKVYAEMKKKGCKFPNIIHRSSIIESSTIIGEGNIILAGANIGSEARLGNLNYINNSSVVSHECDIQNNVHIAPGAILGGRVKIGNNSLIGMNVNVYYDIIIGENVTVNNGVCIDENLADNSWIKR
jgi:sugar O-acyltransferase (sialic acid O-acetyltransferase NeuD family)